MERLHLIIFGDVHGVGFRFSALEIARDLDLVGWVRNRPEGSVEIVAEGPKENLEKLASWAKKGPPSSKVEKVDISWGKTTGEFSSFEVNF